MNFSGSCRDLRAARRARSTAILGALYLLTAVGAAAQTDYYNTDAGRPLTIEDAISLERYAFEVQVAPLRLERGAGGVYTWEMEPEVAYGIFPRTQLEIGAPIRYVDTGRGLRSASLAGVSVSLLHNLNIETSLPALSIAGRVLLPAGGAGPEEAVLSAKAIATRTFRWARFHLNGELTSGDAEGQDEDVGIGSEAGWLAGIAVDRSFPLRSTLIGGEVFVTKAGNTTEELWNAAVGLRRQLSPAFNVDAGIGKQLSGDRAWFVTAGLSHAFAIRSLLPGR